MAYSDLFYKIFITGLFVINVSSHSLLAHDVILCTEASKVEHTVICTSVGMAGIKEGGESFILKSIVSQSRAANSALADTNIAASPVLNKYTAANRGDTKQCVS